MKSGKISFNLPVSSPVEVRDKRMRLVAEGLTSDELEVKTGDYYVQARLPADETLMALVTVEMGETAEIDFADSIARLPSLESSVVAAYKSKGHLIPEFDRPTTAPWKIQFWKFGGWELEQADDIEIEESETDEFDTTTLTIHNRDTEIVFASVASEGTVPVNVALPALGIMDSQRCKLVITTNELGAVARAFPFGSAIDNPARYFADGDLRSAAQYLTPRYAETLLRGKMMDPIAAAFGGYVLLVQGEIERMHDWPANLANRFDYMADGSAIDGERLALLGSHEGACDRFMELRHRGLPIFTDGFSMSLSRLRHYASRGGSRAPRGASAEAQELIRKLDEWALYADFGAMTLTVQTSNLAAPASDSSQLPADLSTPEWSEP